MKKTLLFIILFFSIVWSVYLVKYRESMDSVIFDNTRVENAINTIVNDISSNCYIISNNLDNIYSTLND